MIVKNSSSTPSFVSIRERSGKKLEECVWMVLAKWQTKETMEKHSTAVTQHVKSTSMWTSNMRIEK